MKLVSGAILAFSIMISGRSTLMADTVGTGAFTQGCTFTSFLQSSLDCTALSSDFQSGFSSPSQASFNGPFSEVGASANFNESGYAGAGTFEGYVSESVVSGTYPITGISGGPEVGLEDILTFSDPALNGTAGSLVLGLSLDSSTNASGLFVDPVGSVEGLYAYAGGLVSGTVPYAVYFPGPGTFQTQYTGPSVPFIWGQPVAIEILFSPIVEAGCLSTADCSPSWSYAGPVYVNALDTAILDSLTVYDSAGNLVPSSDWSVSAASGLDYTANGIVPEPSGFAILGLAFATLMSAGWLRRGSK